MTIPNLLLLSFGCTDSGLGITESNGPLLHVPGDVIEGEFVIYADVNSSVAHDLGIEQIDFNDVLGAGLYEATAPIELSTLAAALRTHLRGELVVENNRPRALFADPYRSLQWNLDTLDIEAAWTVTKGAGATVAVIDSGVSSAGEDTPVNLKLGWDFVGNDAKPTDENGHGTHVAGTIAQATDNGLGVSGVAPQATVLAVRAMDANGSGSAWGVAQAITYAVDQGADVINLSLGSAWSTAIEEDAIDYAFDKGVIVVAASGNSGTGTVDYPAAYESVISVGATRADNTVAPYSNTGAALDLVAPGGDMTRDNNGDGYADGILQETFAGSSWGYEFYEGTSMAAPHVAAVAALLISAGANPSDVRGLLQTTATDQGSSGWDKKYGWGLVNPVAALAALGAAPGSAPPAAEEPAPPPADTTAPVVSGVDGSRSGTSLVLWWDTNEPAGSWIDFEDYGVFGDGTLVTHHELSFTISTSSTYVFTIIADDGSGNEGTSGPWVTYP